MTNALYFHTQGHLSIIKPVTFEVIQSSRKCVNWTWQPLWASTQKQTHSALPNSPSPDTQAVTSEVPQCCEYLHMPVPCSCLHQSCVTTGVKQDPDPWHHKEALLLVSPQVSRKQFWKVKESRPSFKTHPQASQMRYRRVSILELVLMCAQLWDSHTRAHIHTRHMCAHRHTCIHRHMHTRAHMHTLCIAEGSYAVKGAPDLRSKSWYLLHRTPHWALWHDLMPCPWRSPDRSSPSSHPPLGYQSPPWTSWSGAQRWGWV